MQAVLAEQRLVAGQLDESLTALQDEVRRDPADSKKRIFLFQLLAIEGQWERALTQLDACVSLDGNTLAMSEVYRPALVAENTRRAVFAGEAVPTLFGTPERWQALLVEALRLSARSQVSEAAALRLQALDAAPATPGTIDGIDFAWLSDADSRLGPVMEVILNGIYIWVPFQHIRTIRIEPPTDLRDLVWLPAAFTWSNGGEAMGLIPTRYPGSEAHNDNEIRLARRTEWQQVADNDYIGLGQRMFASDSDEYALLNIRHVEFKAANG